MSRCLLFCLIIVWIDIFHISAISWNFSHGYGVSEYLYKLCLALYRSLCDFVKFFPKALCLLVPLLMWTSHAFFPSLDSWILFLDNKHSALLSKSNDILQYAFPPSCVGEVGRIGAPSRREIGHGMLAERALEPILPPEEDFPYTIRVESTITESNGSSR